MMGFRVSAKSMVVIVIAAVACASVVKATILEDDKQQLLQNTSVNDESSQDVSEKIASKSSSSSLSISKNATASKHEKKMIHRLIGGHVKLYPKVTEAKDERETPPAVAWDDGLMMSSAGNGKEKSSSKTRQDDDEESKTLSQQVKEGKYGLLQNEIYSTPPKRPGIISYLGNPEVPKDTAKNLGGLEEDEIWLAENHLLVLRGGKFPDHGSKPIKNERKWPPIDDYEAPVRQVKIPPSPEVPPPFPVQLAEGGPVQIIRANGSVINLNETTVDEYDEYANYPEGFFPGEAPFYPFSSNSTDLGYPGNFTTGNGSYLPPEGSLGPFYPPIPPGAVFLPPPSNQSEYEDEDQSIYYPPPYSFYYKQDNSTPVPPGPLVPGIILPPPPNFFASLEEKKSTGKERLDKFETTTTTTNKPEEETTTYPSTPTTRRKTVTKPYKVRFSSTTPITPTFSTGTKPTTRIQPQISKNVARTKFRGFTTTPPTVFTSTPNYVESTTSRPNKPTTISSDYYNVQTEIENHLIDLGAPQGGQWTGIVGSTAVPLLAYYATTSSPLERTRSTDEGRPIEVKPNGQDVRSKNQASYYYYEDKNAEQLRTTTEAPSAYYNVEPISTQRQPKKQYYSVEMIPSQQTANDYDLKLSTLIKNTHSFGYDDQTLRNPTKYSTAVERLRTQSQRTLADNSQRYYQPVTIKPYFTTERPSRYYYETSQSENYDYRDDQELKSNPVYQYSYETTDYADKRQKERYRGQEIREEPATYGDYQPPSTSGQYYDYETQPVEKVRKPEEVVPYLVRTRGPSYNTAGNSGAGIINATPNPQHAYYTKQDEQLLDDVTKQYFTIFGKKLPENVLQSTTPLYRLVGTTTENPLNIHNANTFVPNQYTGQIPIQPVQSFKPPKVKVHYGDQTQRPYSLEGDTLVNYKNPLPPINPDAEFIDVRSNKPITNSRQRDGYRTEHISSIVNRPVGNYVTGSNARETYRGRYTSPPISLANDIAVNYRDPRPQINPDAEFITPPIRGQGLNNQANRGGSYFAYQLPGNGGHFYFLTPQAITPRPNAVNGASEYNIYPKTNGQRIIRRRRIVTTADDG